MILKDRQQSRCPFSTPRGAHKHARGDARGSPSRHRGGGHGADGDASSSRGSPSPPGDEPPPLPRARSGKEAGCCAWIQVMSPLPSLSFSLWTYLTLSLAGPSAAHGAAPATDLVMGSLSRLRDARSTGRRADLSATRSPAWIQAPVNGGIDNRAWMGSASPWMGSLGLSMGFFLFFVFYPVYRGGQRTASEKVTLTVTFDPRRLQKPPR